MFQKTTIHQSIKTGLHKITFTFFFRPSLHQKLTPTETLLSFYYQALPHCSCLGDISFKSGASALLRNISFPINKGALN